jgi:hypothetical protein
MAFKLDDYEPVAARLDRWLKQEHAATPRVITHLVHYTDNRCVFRAELYEGDVLMATGWAEETRGEGMVNKTSHLENCESSSVGRALANAGLSGSDHTKRPSREEMTKVARNTQGEPAEDPFAASPAPQYDKPGNPGKASDKQVGMIRALGRSKGFDSGAKLINEIGELLGRQIGLLTDLTKADASKVIDAWKGS